MHSLAKQLQVAIARDHPSINARCAASQEFNEHLGQADCQATHPCRMRLISQKFCDSASTDGVWQGVVTTSAKPGSTTRSMTGMQTMDSSAQLTRANLLRAILALRPEVSLASASTHHCHGAVQSG